MKKKLIVLLTISLTTLLFVTNQAAARKKKKEAAAEEQSSYQALLAQMAQLQQPQPPPEPKGKPKKGWALGVEGADIISLRMKLTGFTLDILGKLEFDLGKAETDDKAMFDLYAGCRFVKVFADGKKVRLNIFAGGILESKGSRDDPGGQTNFYAIAGFAPELFIARNFSLETTAGAQMALIGDDAATAGNDGRITLGTYGNNINFNAGIAFHCYF
jgi:hypothetical protein